MKERLYEIYDCDGNIDRTVTEDELENYFYCEDCGRYFLENAVEELEDNWGTYTGNFICNNCSTSYNYGHCQYCGSFHYDSDLIYVEDVGAACEHCCDRYSYCSECGRYYDNDDIAHYDDDTGDNYCRYCWDEVSSSGDYVYDYHEFRDWHFFKNEDEEEPPYYIGFEDEIEPKNSPCHEEVVPLIKNSINAVCMHDGSLDYGGIEIVSHPQSFKYIMAHKEDYFKLFKKLTDDYDYVSHNTETCGLHFHVSRPNNEEVINRIWHIMETYKDELIRFSRRNYGQIEHWAKFLSDNCNERNLNVKLKSLKYIGEHKETYNRYYALNLTNTGTIEFRFIRGTLKPETFFASVELINNIMTLCSDLSIPIEDITWERLIDSEYARAYCKDINLVSNKRPLDLTERLDTYLKAQEDLLLKAQRLVENISNKKLKDLNEKVVNVTPFIKSTTIEALDDKIPSLVREVRDEEETLRTLKDMTYTADKLMNSSYELEHYFFSISKYYKTRLLNISKRLLKLNEELAKEVI